MSKASLTLVVLLVKTVGPVKMLKVEQQMPSVFFHIQTVSINRKKSL